ncbi:hypothetical protein HPB52_010352 [Rhipicephalus sanguineus]|uniref:XLF-like coiled-coil region domain-containing protein n=1 Tax=Rhipicephalus sanguineus TaxID=34632 RepID=A0A9D4PQS1_RHISA|nr:hypothetical protein HPB52_010352 [Rhipicephalus sanguineus]
MKTPSKTDAGQDLNPSIEVTTKGLVRHLSDGLTAAIERSSKHSPELTATIDSSSLVFALSMAIGEVKFLWNFTMAAQSADDFYSQVTLPMLVMLAAMKEQRERLFALLSKKDAEIKDYTSSGARASKSKRIYPKAPQSYLLLILFVLKRHFANLTESAFAGDELGKIMKAYQELSTLSPQKSSSPSDKQLPAESSEQTSMPTEDMYNSKPVQSKALSPEVTPEKPKIKKAKKRLRL